VQLIPLDPTEAEEEVDERGGRRTRRGRSGTSDGGRNGRGGRRGILCATDVEEELEEVATGRLKGLTLPPRLDDATATLLLGGDSLTTGLLLLSGDEGGATTSGEDDGLTATFLLFLLSPTEESIALSGKLLELETTLNLLLNSLLEGGLTLVLTALLEVSGDLLLLTTFLLGLVLTTLSEEGELVKVEVVGVDGVALRGGIREKVVEGGVRVARGEHG
jgi:hypothetical protein